MTALEVDSLDDTVGDSEVLHRAEQPLRLKHAVGAVVVGGVNVGVGAASAVANFSTVGKSCQTCSFKSPPGGAVFPDKLTTLTTVRCPRVAESILCMKSS
jgi:hypothetical protein